MRYSHTRRIIKSSRAAGMVSRLTSFRLGAGQGVPHSRIVGVKGVPQHPAHLAFDTGRYCVMDLCRVFLLLPSATAVDRLPPDELAGLRAVLNDCSMPLAAGAEADRRLAALRQEYELYLQAISNYLQMPLPRWVAPEEPGAPEQSSASHAASVPTVASISAPG